MHLLALGRKPVSREHRDRFTSFCDRRGHCGPFVNEDFYRAFPDAMWQGMGDCVECGSTRNVEAELQKTPGRNAA